MLTHKRSVLVPACCCRFNERQSCVKSVPGVPVAPAVGTRLHPFRPLSVRFLRKCQCFGGGGSIVSIVSRPEGGTHLRQHRRGGQGSLRECVLSFRRACPWDYNEVIRFGGLYLPPHRQGGLLRRRGSFHLPDSPGVGMTFT